MNPGLPYCQGHDFAIKKKPKKAGATDKSATANSQAAVVDAEIEDDATPSVIVVGGVDWRFADPQADGLMSVSFSRLSATPLALGLMAALGSKQGLSVQEMGRVFDAFSSVDQVALSIRGERVLLMVTGSPADAASNLEAGWKATQVRNALLIGTSGDVDEAAQRMAEDGPLSELARLAKQQQANGNFWAAGSGGMEGVKHFTLTASMRDRLTSDITFELSRAADANTALAAMGTMSLEGNSVHFKMSMEADELEQSVEEIAATPLGRYLGILVKAGRTIPVANAAGATHAKPVIHGLNDNPNQ